VISSPDEARSGPVYSPLLRSAIVLGACLLALLLAAPKPAAAEDPHKPYALIFGTVWGPDDRPVYGVKVLIQRADQKKPSWELYSNHTGEFAQRVPAGKADYIVWADARSVKVISNNNLHPGTEVTVRVAGDERVDIGLHLKQ
jgi:hypothetical protein